MMFLGLNIKGGGYMNSITDLLDLEDNDVIISNIDVQGQTKVLTLETRLQDVLPRCKGKDYQPSNSTG